MTLRDEIILMAISSFCDEDNIADFVYMNINNVCKNDSFKKYTQPLIENNLIKDLTVNGYAKRFKVLKPVGCPSFIFTPMDIKLKEYVLQLWKDYKQYGEFKNRKVRYDEKLKILNISDFNIQQSEFIKNKISSDGTLIKTEFGYKIVTKTKDIKEYKCFYCGQTNSENFYKGSQTICKECSKRIQRKQISIEERLYNRSLKAAKSCHREYDLDIAYIKSLLLKQNNKCAYSGVEFGDNFLDKLTYPTIDRIDSSKGYVKGNVCICSFYTNVMKSNMSIKQFKDTITKIYNNLNNF